MGGDRFPYEDTPVAIGKKVVVLGAGNTAMDCLRVSRRLGAEEVHCLYRRTEAEAPCRVEELRHAKEEGIHFHWLMSPTEIRTDEKGNVTAIVVQKMELGEPDKSGRRRPVPIEGAYETFECETVIYALGTRANPVISRTTPNLSVRGEGYINVDPKTQAASIPGIFAGGDIVTGGATVILALGAGRRAAKAIEKYLKTKEWPVVLEEEAEPAKAAPAPQVPVEAACPKCRRPLEPGDEEHICCAGEKIVWTCGSCQKVSEGFAFPYGLCPACGGTLTPGHDTKVESEAAVTRSGRPSRSSWGASPSTRGAPTRWRRRTRTSHSSSATSRRWSGATWTPSRAATTSRRPRERSRRTSRRPRWPSSPGPR